MRSLKYILYFLVIPIVAQGATWYVDSAATGSNDGRSWANAWTSFSAIVWNYVGPGDFIYISGGPSGGEKVYRSTLSVPKNGTASQRITIGIDAGSDLHNGTAVIEGTYIEASGRQYITFSGNVNGARRLMIRDYFNPSVATYANAVMAPDSVGLTFDSILWSNVNNCINLINSTGFYVVNCQAIQTRGDAVIRAGSAHGTGYEANIIEGCDFEVVVNSTDGGGPDGIQTGNNITARNNTFRVRRVSGFYTSNQHSDMFQAPGIYLAIYNNDFINVGDSCIALGAWWSDSIHKDIRIFNNIFRITEAIDPYPEYIRLYNNVGPIKEISNLLIANNLFVDNPGWNNVIFSNYGPNGSNPVGSNNCIANNIWYNSGSGLCWRLDWSSNWSPSSWKIDGNIYYGNSSVRYQSMTYAAATWVASNEPNGSTDQPVFVAYSPKAIGNDYRLADSDTVAIDRAITLSEFDFDRFGTPRPQGAAWDSGPHERVSTGPSPGLINLAQDQVTVNQDAGMVTLLVRRANGSDGAVGITFATADGTAAAGTDYAAASGTLTWEDGGTIDQAISVELSSVGFEGSKTFSISLSNPTGGATLGSPSVATITVVGSLTPQTVALAVRSSNPDAGVSIEVAPEDVFHAQRGSTPFNLAYNPSVDVTLTAPSAAGNNLFQKWQRDGVDISPSPTMTVTMDAPHTVTAIYAVPVYYTITINSQTPNNGIAIDVSPADRTGAASGTTPFSRTFLAGTDVTLTAPLTAGTSNFQKWQWNGGADSSTTPTVKFKVGSNQTYKAVYRKR